MLSKNIQKILFAAVVLILLLASFFVGRLQNKPINVQAQEIPGDENRAWTSFDCEVIQVGIFSNRAHILCSNYKNVDGDEVHYFAVADTSANEMFINRMMAIGLTNVSMNKNVLIYFDSDKASNPPSCLTSNCHKLLAVEAK